MKFGKLALASAVAALAIMPVAASAGTVASSSLKGVNPVLTSETGLSRGAAPMSKAQDLAPGTWVLILLALVAGGYGFYEAVKSKSNG